MYSLTFKRESFKVIDQLTKSAETARQGLRKGFFALGKELQKTSRAGIKNPPKTGRFYLFKGRRIRASAPGEYPRNRSGVLRKSIIFIVDGTSKLIFGSGKAGQSKASRSAPYSLWKNSITSNGGMSSDLGELNL